MPCFMKNLECEDCETGHDVYFKDNMTPTSDDVVQYDCPVVNGTQSITLPFAPVYQTVEQIRSERLTGLRASHAALNFRR